MAVFHQNHPAEGSSGYARSTPYLCDTPYNPEDGAGRCWQKPDTLSLEEYITCSLCRAQPGIGLSRDALRALGL